MQVNTKKKKQPHCKISDDPGIEPSCLRFHSPHASHYASINNFSLTVTAATLIFIYGLGLAISSAKQGKTGSIYNLVKN